MLCNEQKKMHKLSEKKIDGLQENTNLMDEFRLLSIERRQQEKDISCNEKAMVITYPYMNHFSIESCDLCIRGPCDCSENAIR